MINVLGVDPSLTGTGLWCHAWSGVISPATRGNQRLLEISDAVIDQATQVDVVVIESPVVYAHGTMTLQLGGLATLLRYRLWENSITYVDVTASQRMKWATGKGSAKKDAVLLAASRRFGYTGESDDEADALVIWNLGHVAYNGRPDKELTVPEREVLVAVDWPEIMGVDPNVTWPNPVRRVRKVVVNE